MSTLRIADVARRYGYTQTTLAEKMGVSKSAVRWYYQQDNLTLSLLRKIAEAIGCELWQLIATEYEVLKTAEGDVLTPDGKRYKINDLHFCFDSKL